jgi:hypothetical protein
MLDFDKSLMTAIFVYLLACFALYQLKHPKMFDENGHFKAFGLHKNETVFPFWLVTTVIGLTSYYVLVLRSRA